jgi:fused signal recognition particle receptor
MPFLSLFGSNKEPEKSETPQEPEESGEKKSGFFSRMKQAVTRTRESFSQKIEGIVALTRIVDESALEDLESALLSSDIGVQTTDSGCAA